MGFSPLGIWVFLGSNKYFAPAVSQGYRVACTLHSQPQWVCTKHGWHIIIMTRSSAVLDMSENADHHTNAMG